MSDGLNIFLEMARDLTQTQNKSPYAVSRLGVTPLQPTATPQVAGMDPFLDMARRMAGRPVPKGNPFLDMARELTDNRALTLVKEFTAPSPYQQTETYGQERIRALGTIEAPRVTLRAPFTDEQFQGALYAIYRHIFGNTYVMESERPTTAESQLKDGRITVRGFIKLLAKSEVYRSRFFQKTSQNRFIELNHKLLLGRAPYDQAEISAHLDLWNTQGYDAEIDSYVESEEYLENFGEDVIPYFRGFKYQTGQSAQGFNRLLDLYGGWAGSDTDRNQSGQVARLTNSLVRPGQVVEPPVAPPLEFTREAERAAWLAGALTLPSSLGHTETHGQERIRAVGALEAAQVTLRAPFTEEQFQGALYAIYKQVFGNTYVMESERPTTAESQLKDGRITVRGFIRLLAKTEAYKSRFLYTTSQNRFIELNHKLLLGRAPYDQAEIIRHLDLWNSQGYDAEIDSYIESEEYQEFFGEEVVPFFRGFKYQVGQNPLGFNGLVRLYDGYAGSDTERNQSGQVARLTDRLSRPVREQSSVDRIERLLRSYTSPSPLEQTNTYGQERVQANAVLETPQVTLRAPFTEEQFQGALYAIYKQVFGNTYVMESERPATAESQLRDGRITVRGFIRLLAKSDTYKARFFNPATQTRFIELNHKLLLGRAPYDQAEISRHVALYTSQGYEAEIDSYLDSEEYQECFGEDTVPFFRGFTSQPGQSTEAFNRMVTLYDGYATSDSEWDRGGQSARLTDSLARSTMDQDPEYRIGNLISSYTRPSPYGQPQGYGQERIQATAVLERPRATLRVGTTENLEGVIYAIYQQVLGNTHVMTSERLLFAESQLRDGKLTVRGFIRQLAKSEAYKTRFFYPSSQTRFIELNHKLLLGRAPYDQAEISHHVTLYTSQGYDLEIDSYLDSEEYQENFGEDTVPFLRGFTSQPGQVTEAFNRMVNLNDGYATSDSGWSQSAEVARLTESLSRPVREAGASVRVERLLNALTQPSSLGQSPTFGQEQIQATAVLEESPVTLRAPFTEEQLQGALYAIYKQVLGKTHVMESERPTFAESQLRDGKLTVRGFVRQVAQSEAYKARFFNPAAQTRFIELNHKLLLGRAPYDQAEISRHVALYTSQGYEAEIDSYLDSEEYQENFGEDTVPFLRGFTSQPGQSTEAFNRMVTLYDGYAASDGQTPRPTDSLNEP
ncbi:phycobilisome rod-core linker polypeptide [Anthocerotibacter panamensis]|uniref:CpcN n=1 Tax=Anthocerotibacter panamensis TaxID=2857077 RepID=A0AAJ6N6G5_9CYAN|nr:phycobilisome rod-core linker polypeptide [Anthocerotibacter panamensis]8IMN_5 Chain 5, CpcN [Anthocerotibacter panamensis]8IMO_5 Chain 5, CpcN [Anthocerotibacter panamensis]